MALGSLKSAPVVSLWLAVLTAACSAVAARETPLPAASTSRSSAQGASKFLVHLESGAIAVRTLGSTDQRILIDHADAALYDPVLGLVWFREADRLNVRDLRVPESKAIALASGVPPSNRFSIRRGAYSVETEDGCDLPFVAIEWASPATAESLLEDAPDLRIDNQTWFYTQLDRPAQAQGERRAFDLPKVSVPQEKLDCEDASTCCTTTPFGGLNYELVLVVEKMGGDCWQRECLLHDRQTGKFATPPNAQHWTDVASAATGPCGPYLFDRTQTNYLIDTAVCSRNGQCEPLSGRALGWLTPGDAVGMPGLGNFND
jgi:hypothetical protein